MRLSINILLLILLFSCKKAEVPAEEMPISTFDSPFPKNNKQLDRIFGETLLIKSDKDTLVLKIKSNKENNLITTKDGDTIFFGKICKYRDYYYFNHKVNDSSYYISAFKIKGNLIYGLDFIPQYFTVDEYVLKGSYSKYVKSINSDSSKIRLYTNKSELKKLFTLIMKDIIPDTLVNPKSEINNITQNELAENKKETNKEIIGYDVKIYPNPAVDFINVDLNKKSIFQLINSNSKIVLQGQLNDLKNRIDISNQKSGLYFLVLKDIGENETKTLKILIK